MDAGLAPYQSSLASHKGLSYLSTTYLKVSNCAGSLFTDDTILYQELSYIEDTEKFQHNIKSQQEQGHHIQQRRNLYADIQSKWKALEWISDSLYLEVALGRTWNSTNI